MVYYARKCTKQEVADVKAEKIPLLLGIILIILLAFLIVWQADMLGVSAGRLDSIYLSRDGFSFGYFFRQGGFDPYMADSVKGIVFEDKGIALLSLNEDGVCKIVVDNDTEEKVISVDPEEPFAVVLPVDCGAITMYDAQENIVTLYDTYTGI